MKYELEKSSIIPNFIERVQAAGYNSTAKDAADFYNSTIVSMVEFLARAKSKEKKTSIAIRDLKGNLKIAAIAAYYPNENENEPGNWSVVFTFDKEDLDDTTQFNTNDTQFQQVALQVMHKVGGFIINNAAIVQTLYEIAIDCLLYWADSNAKEGEANTIVQKGFFELSVDIENGEKVIGLLPDETVKQRIKDDASIEASDETK